MLGDSINKLWNSLNNLSDTITNQWLWFGS